MKYTATTCALMILWLAALGCTPNPSVFSAPVPSPTAIPSGGALNVIPTPVRATSAGMVKGKIMPARYARLAFGTSGVVARILVNEGDPVRAGDMLAVLDLKDLELRVKSAQDSLDIAVATLAQAKAPSTREEITAAEAAYEAAVTALAKLQKGPTRDELASQRAEVDKATAALDQAQAAYDRAGGSSNPYIGMMPQALKLQQATSDLEIAEANYNKAIAPDPAEIAQAKSQIAQAEATLAMKKSAPKLEDVALAQARVQQAETGLEQAQAEIKKAKLIAPMAGQVVGIALREGEAIQAGSLAATLVDLSELRVVTTELDEFGVTSIRIGQDVKIAVDALPDELLSGRVVSIVPPQVPIEADDSPFYVATIAIAANNSEIKYGMTVRVDFSIP